MIGTLVGHRSPPPNGHVVTIWFITCNTVLFVLDAATQSCYCLCLRFSSMQKNIHVDRGELLFKSFRLGLMGLTEKSYCFKDNSMDLSLRQLHRIVRRLRRLVEGLSKRWISHGRIISPPGLGSEDRAASSHTVNKIYHRQTIWHQR